MSEAKFVAYRLGRRGALSFQLSSKWTTKGGQNTVVFRESPDPITGDLLTVPIEKLKMTANRDGFRKLVENQTLIFESADLKSIGYRGNLPDSVVSESRLEELEERKDREIADLKAQLAKSKAGTELQNSGDPIPKKGPKVNRARVDTEKA